MLNFLTNPLYKLGAYIVGFLLLSGILYGLWVSHINSVKREALLEFNKKQMEQVIADQNKHIQALTDIQAKAAEILAETKAKNDKIDEKFNNLDTILSSKETLNNAKPASDILKQTVKELSR